MSVRLQRLHELRHWFRQHIAWVFDQAYGVDLPAGSSPGWEQICANYHVRMASEQEREQMRAAQRPTRGAPVMEFRDVVLVVLGQARGGLRSIDCFSGSYEERTEWERMRRLLDRTEEELLSAYRKAVLPSLAGGMFANVMAHAGGPGAQVVKASASTLRCQNCAAPRLSDKDFTCEFCGEQMIKPQPLS